jgi:hypothetical protein
MTNIFTKLSTLASITVLILLANTANATLIKVSADFTSPPNCLSLDLTEVKDCAQYKYDISSGFSVIIEFEETVAPSSTWIDGTLGAVMAVSYSYRSLVKSVELTIGGFQKNWSYENVLSGEAGLTDVLPEDTYSQGESLRLSDNNTVGGLTTSFHLTLGYDGIDTINGSSLDFDISSNLLANGGFGLGFFDRDNDLRADYFGRVKSLSVVNVPEPSTLTIFALGMIGLASRRFKKQ